MDIIKYSARGFCSGAPPAARPASAVPIRRAHQWHQSVVLCVSDSVSACVTSRGGRRIVCIMYLHVQDTFLL